MPASSKPDSEKFLTDPEFQGDRDVFNALIDARLSHHAEEAAKPDSPSRSLFAKIFSVFTTEDESLGGMFDRAFGGGLFKRGEKK